MKYLLIPIVKNPHYRIGPEEWQDWYRQVEKTILIAKRLKNDGDEAVIAIIANFQPKGQPSEIEIYKGAFDKLAPDLHVNYYKETRCTAEQVERSFELQKEIGGEIIFISAWMQYPRVIYLAHGRKARHFGAFGIPSPAFAILDPLCIIIEPLADMLRIGNFSREMIVNRRKKGKIL